MALNDITNTIITGSDMFKTTAVKVGSLVNKGGDHSAIRDRFLNGFLNSSNQFNPTVFARMFDEPTYLTFRVEFDFSPNLEYNRTDTLNINYLPEPLLAFPDKSEDWGTYNSISSGVKNPYSTYCYLKNALGETQRANMLKGFIESLKDIQDNYPYYFKSVDGLSDITTVDPTKGRRIIDKSITIKCMEGLDLKITQLMQLYRKIAWDDVYQRWILPDMMRYFTLRVYVSEIRLFHTMSQTLDKKTGDFLIDFASPGALTARYKDALSSGNIISALNSTIASVGMVAANMLGDGNIVSKISNDTIGVAAAADSVIDAIQGYSYLCDNAINDVMPTMCFECRQCEFDLGNTLSHINSLSSNNKNKTDLEPQIKIKVGNIKETMVFPLQKDLQGSENKYLMNKNISFKYIDDYKLQKEATYNKDSFELENDILVQTNLITNKFKRINPAYGTVDNITDEAYNPFSPSKGLAAMSLFTGIMGIFFSNLNSTAIDGEKAESLKNSNEFYNSIRKIIASDGITEVVSAATTLLRLTGGVLNDRLDPRSAHVLPAKTEIDAMVSAAEDSKDADKIKAAYNMLEFYTKIITEQFNEYGGLQSGQGPASDRLGDDSERTDITGPKDEKLTNLSKGDKINVTRSAYIFPAKTEIDAMISAAQDSKDSDKIKAAQDIHKNYNTVKGQLEEYEDLHKLQSGQGPASDRLGDDSERTDITGPKDEKLTNLSKNDKINVDASSKIFGQQLSNEERQTLMLGTLLNISENNPNTTLGKITDIILNELDSKIHSMISVPIMVMDPVVSQATRPENKEKLNGFSFLN